MTPYSPCTHSSLDTSAQCCFAEQSPPLLPRDVDADDMPLLCVRLRGTAAEHGLPALHADARGQAVQEMRGKLGNKLAACQGRSGVGCEARDNHNRMACARVEGNFGRRIRERTLGKGV